MKINETYRLHFSKLFEILGKIKEQKEEIYLGKDSILIKGRFYEEEKEIGRLTTGANIKKERWPSFLISSNL